MRFALFALLAFSLMLGCTGLMESGESPRTSAASAPLAYKAADYDGQYITKEGYIKIKVGEGTLEDEFESLKASLQSEGAQLSDITYSEYGESRQYTLRIKVSPSRFDSISRMLQDVGEVKDMSVQFEDVTEQYSDLDTRIRNREAELERLYELYNKSDNVSDLLQVEREVTRVETDLEMLKGQKQRLLSSVEKSTIDISIYEEKPATSQLALTIEGLAALFFGAMSAAITVLVAVAGFLLPLSLAIGAIWFAYRKVAGEKKARPRQAEHERMPPAK